MATIKANHPTRNKLVNLPNYFDSKAVAISVIRAILQDHNLDLAGYPDCDGTVGNVLFPIRSLCANSITCDSCGSDCAEFDNVVSFSWYRMPSGKFEIVAYIS